MVCFFRYLFWNSVQDAVALHVDMRNHKFFCVLPCSFLVTWEHSGSSYSVSFTEHHALVLMEWHVLTPVSQSTRNLPPWLEIRDHISSCAWYYICPQWVSSATSSHVHSVLQGYDTSLISLILLAGVLVLSADDVTLFTVHPGFQIGSKTYSCVAPCVVTSHHILPTSQFLSSWWLFRWKSPVPCNSYSMNFGIKLL